MAQIAVKPRVFKNYLLKFGTAGDNYEKHVSNVTLTPSSSVVTWKGAAAGAVYTDVTEATWTLTLEYAQDWETTNSLSQYLLANEGSVITGLQFSPLGSGAKFTVDVVVTPGAIGGAIDAVGTAQVTLGVQGKPVYTAGA